MGVNEPLPGQLTVGRLRKLLEGVHDQAVVALLVQENLEVPPPFHYVLANLKVATVASAIVTLEVYPDTTVTPPDPIS